MAGIVRIINTAITKIKLTIIILRKIQLKYSTKILQFAADVTAASTHLRFSFLSNEKSYEIEISGVLCSRYEHAKKLDSSLRMADSWGRNMSVH
jgi:hypothetical protein